MVNKIKWMHEFMNEVPEKQVNYLLYLGLPVAGEKFTVDGDMIHFGKNFAVDRKNHLYYKGSPVTPKVWCNLAVLEKMKRGMRINLIKNFGIKGVRYMNYGGPTVQKGRVVIQNIDMIMYEEFTDPFHGIHFNGHEYVFPPGTPNSTELHVDRDVDLLFRDGDIVYGITHMVEYNEYYITMGLKDSVNLYFGNPAEDEKAYDKLQSILKRGDIRELHDFSREFVFSRMKRGSGRIEIEHTKILYRPYEIIVGKFSDWSEIEKIRGEIEGWNYYNIDGSEFYKKKIGKTILTYEPAFGEFSINAVNGWVLRMEVPPDMVPMNLKDLIRVILIS